MFNCCIHFKALQSLEIHATPGRPLVELNWPMIALCMVSLSNVVHWYCLLHYHLAEQTCTTVLLTCSGLIGRSWAMLYAGVGYSVVLYDVVEQQVTAALADIAKQLEMLAAGGLLRGSLSAKQQLACISGELNKSSLS